MMDSEMTTAEAIADDVNKFISETREETIKRFFLLVWRAWIRAWKLAIAEANAIAESESIADSEKCRQS